MINRQIVNELNHYCELYGQVLVDKCGWIKELAACVK